MMTTTTKFDTFEEAICKNRQRWKRVDIVGSVRIDGVTRSAQRCHVHINVISRAPRRGEWDD